MYMQRNEWHNFNKISLSHFSLLETGPYTSLIHTHTLTHPHTHTHTHTTLTHTHTHARTHTHTHTHITLSQTHTHPYTHTRTHARTHTLTHAHTQTHVHAPPPPPPPTHARTAYEPVLLRIHFRRCWHKNSVHEPFRSTQSSLQYSNNISHNVV